MAYDFNGSDQYLYVAAAVADAAPMAMSCWFKPDNTTTWGELVAISKDTGSDVTNFFRLSCYGNHATADPLVAQTADGSSIAMAMTSTNFVSGQWQHAFAVFAANNSRAVWLNGGGSGTDTASRTPSGLNRTAIGTKIRQLAPGYSGSFDGQIAEVAVWAGSGVENMGALQAGALAAGLSPWCLRKWISNLVLYQDLIRPLNRPGGGATLTAMNGPTVAAQPRVIGAASERLGMIPPHAFGSPYSADAAAAHASPVISGAAALAGAALGEIVPVGEVSG
jgi:hypothetical protein